MAAALMKSVLDSDRFALALLANQPQVVGRDQIRGGATRLGLERLSDVRRVRSQNAYRQPSVSLPLGEVKGPVSGM
jgi:hypothetical protein